MAWDIYGDRLRSGHCEMHPHVHETYPCSLCISQAMEQEHYRRQKEEYYRQLAAEEHRAINEGWLASLGFDPVAMGM